MPLQLAAEVSIETAVPLEIDEAGLTDLMRFGLVSERASGDWQIELVVGDDALLQQLHRDFMGLDSATDIMTFPEHDDPDDETRVTGGQIAISAERAAAQAAEFGLSVSDEVRFLVLHGVLHLCGWDDDTDLTRAAMLDRQTEVLRAFDRPR